MGKVIAFILQVVTTMSASPLSGMPYEISFFANSLSPVSLNVSFFMNEITPTAPTSTERLDPTVKIIYSFLPERLSNL